MWRKFDAYVVGYYGMHNTGDDALLLATLFGAQSELGCQKIKVGSASALPADIFNGVTANLRYPQSFKGQNRLLHYYHAARSKRIIFGGGSVFHTASDIQLKRQLMALSDPKKSAALGVSLGPFNDNEAEDACRKFLMECGYVGVRDAKSYMIAKRLAPQANVDYTFDLAAILWMHPAFTTFKGQKQGVLFNLCPMPLDAFGHTNPQTEERRITYLCQTIYRVWEETKEPIGLINLNAQDNSDTRISEQICQKLMGKVPIKVIPYCPNPFYAIEEISRFKAIASMRLHGCILGYLAGVPTLALNYHEKCHQWSKQIGIPDSYCFDANQLHPQKLADTLITGLKSSFERPSLLIFDAVQLSLKNWRTDYAHAQDLSRDSSVQQSSSYFGHAEKRI